MTNITLRVPDEVNEIVSGISETLYVEALKEVARQRISYTQNRRDELQKKSHQYQEKQDQSYEIFSSNLPDNLQAHEDWIEWAYTVKVVNELNKKIEKLRFLIGK